MHAFAAHLARAWPLAKRDVMARYRGSVAGVLWTLAGPLAMVGIYSAVFQGVFKARWAGTGGDGVDFALRVFAGLVVFSAVAEVATRATRLVQDNANLVKRVVFPLELLCVALVMQVGVHVAIQLLVLGALQAVWGGGLGPSAIWLLLAVPWLVVLMLALALGLSALGCYLRDLQHLVPLAMSGLLFLSPVFFPQSAAPPVLKAVLAINPLSGPIEAFRTAFFGQPFDWESAGWSLGGALLALVVARALFARLRPGFADLV
ncbi:ABC transporter permease [Ideonella sp. A 288]|uniref:ABC transporter permease n=1 Tax=Ideonella sp. A 288 TaxID=1962181 RepID=UPI000B4BBA4E|nr:ABC transporter permease [Ideonella sp. A 288]